MSSRNPLHKLIAFANVITAAAVCFTGVTATNGEDVDVYFIVGQSNAINFAKEANTGSTGVGYTLHFARTSDLFNDFPNYSGVADSFSSSNLNTSLATSILANELQQDNRDVALFAFARNGAGLHFRPDPPGNPWIWYPGADPAAGDYYNDSLYANFVTWMQTRMTALTNTGDTPTVKGLFWFQGEKDGRLGDHDLYEENLDNLVARFRQDYGQDLPIVVTQIREITDTAANRVVINNTMQQTATEDSLMDYVLTEDLEFRSATDVHLNGAGHAELASRWSQAMLQLQANQNPESIAPENVTAFRGIAVSNNLSDYEESDDVKAEFNPGFTLNATEAPVWLVFEVVAPDISQIEMESSAATPGLTATIEAFNFNSFSYDVIGTMPEAFNSDSINSFDIIPADHIHAGGNIQARVGWRRTGFTIVFPWTVRVDQFSFNE